MTCIVGLKHNGHVYMGCDSMVTDGWGWDILPEHAKKLFRVGELLIGGTGIWKMCQLVQFRLDINEQTQSQSDFEYMSVIVAEGIRVLLKDAGCAKIENSQEDSEGEFLVAYRGELYHIDSVYAVRPLSRAFGAVGSGKGQAIGALAILVDSNMSPKKTLRRALAVSAQFAQGVSSPFHVMKL